MNRARRAIRSSARRGALLGVAAGIIAAIYYQVWPRIMCPPDSVYSGAPQGEDQFVYMSLARAIWRSPNGFTYEYPFQLFWPAPAVMLQFPLVLVAWMGRLFGLPMGFELARILGCAGTGAALGAMAARLCPAGSWRRWFCVLTLLGGGWFAWIAVGHAFRISGPGGLTEWWEYMPYAMGQLYSWLPFVFQNIVYPMEPLYHAIVLGGLALLILGRPGLALAVGLAVWFSHPFSAAVLSSAAMLYWFLRLIISRCQGKPAGLHLGGVCIVQLIAWILISAIGLAYYRIFLEQWPIYRALNAQHQVASVSPLTPWQAVGLFGPFLPALLWSVASPSGRRHVWHHPGWAVLGSLAVAQAALLFHGALLRTEATQPFHFNRGYLEIGLVAVTLRAAMILSIRRLAPRTPGAVSLASLRVIPGWFVVLAALLLFDQPLYFIRALLQGVQTGYVEKDLMETLNSLPDSPAPQVVFVEAPKNAILVPALTNHVFYNMPEVMAVPFEAEREARFNAALDSPTTDSLARLGLSYAILAGKSELNQRFQQQGWELLREGQRYNLWCVPPENNKNLGLAR
ncbi:MAG: hypothetical protein K1X53_17655 [Candidatus Sumerlaeaceae bacterium]|nr:hypothetical protein [Candidatus Sumerlaeaceae bacterium]